MADYLFLIGYTTLIAALLLGCYKYSYLDAPMRIVLLLLFFSSIVETFALKVNETNHSKLKDILYHVCPVIELVIITTFFLVLHQPDNYKVKMICFNTFWLTIGLLNTIWLQPVSMLNTNMLMIECFSIITMCLYSIYDMLKNGRIGNITNAPFFWISVFWLLEWSSNFFFWAFVKILYNRHWAYMGLAMNLHIVTNIIVYLALTLVFFKYPKKMIPFENR